MSSGQRFKFQGSTFQVQTGLEGSPLAVITGLTSADPGVVTSAAHGQALGDVVRIDAVVGMAEVNDHLFVVDNPVTDSFELAGTDTSNNDTYTSGGTFDVATFSEFCELTGVNQQDGTSDELEVTTICSTAKEFELGLSDSGTLSLDYNFAPNGTVQAALRAAKISGEELAFRVTFPNDGGTIVMLGKVQQSSFQGAVSGVWTGSSTIKLTGEVFVLEAA